MEAMEDINAPEPMGFGELFTRTFALIGRTLSSAALPALVIIIVLMIIQGFGTMLYFDGAIKAMPLLRPDASEEDLAAGGTMILKALVPMLLTWLVLGFGLVFVQVMTAIAGWNALNDEPLTLGELMDRTVGRPLWYGILQTIIFGLILFVVLMILSIIMFGAGGGGAAGGIILGLIFLYPLLATALRIHEVSIEDRGPWHGLIASIALVNSNFGRIFGALAVYGIIFGVILIGISTITGTGGLSMMGMQGSQGNDPAAALETLKMVRENYTWGVVILNSIVVGIVSIFGLYLLTPLYADSRARRGDFLPQPEDEYGMV